MGRVSIFGRFVGDAYMRPVGFARQVGNNGRIARAVNDRPYKTPANVIGGAVRRERVGGASKNVS